MWEALMMLRLLASLGSPLPIRPRAKPPVVPANAFKGAIRLSFDTRRLSLPLSRQPDGPGNHGRKIA